VIQTKSLVIDYASKAVLVAPTALGLLVLAMERHLAVVERARLDLSLKRARAVMLLRSPTAMALLVVMMVPGRAPLMDPTSVETNNC